MVHLIVEQTFGTPLTDDDHGRLGERLDKCLEAYGARWVRSYLSTDRQRMVCEFEAPDLATSRPDVRAWLRLAIRPSIARRALKYGIGVGTVLIIINHGDALVRGDVSAGRLLRMLLTMTVPYLVSTASSVGALMERETQSVHDV